MPPPVFYGLDLPIVLRGYPESKPTSTTASAPTPTPTPIPGPRQLILNPSFESDEAWQIPHTVYPAGYSSVCAHTGLRSMRLGIASGDNIYSYSSVQQAVQIPAGVTQADLTFYYFPLMASPDVDLIYFCILEARNDMVLQCNIWTELNQSWKLGAFSLLSYAGQRVKVHFGVKNDGLGGISALYLGDVELYVR